MQWNSTSSMHRNKSKKLINVLFVMIYSNFLKFKLEWKPFIHSFFVCKRTKEIKSESGENLEYCY
jgi:hypothetical protein